MQVQVTLGWQERRTTETIATRVVLAAAHCFASSPSLSHSLSLSSRLRSPIHPTFLSSALPFPFLLPCLSSSPFFHHKFLLLSAEHPSSLLFRLLPLTHKYQQPSHPPTSPYLSLHPSIHPLTLSFPHHLPYASLLTTPPPLFSSSSTISPASLRCQGYLLSSTSLICSSSSAAPALPTACAPFAPPTRLRQPASSRQQHTPCGSN